jgi:hypothetical protein
MDWYDTSLSYLRKIGGGGEVDFDSNRRNVDSWGFEILGDIMDHVVCGNVVA